MTYDKRPLSPDMQIYRPQLTSVLSISHRVTGIALSVGTLLLIVWLIAAADGPHTYSTVQGFLTSWVGLLLLLGWTFSSSFIFATASATSCGMLDTASSYARSMPPDGPSLWLARR